MKRIMIWVLLGMLVLAACKPTLSAGEDSPATETSPAAPQTDQPTTRPVSSPDSTATSEPDPAADTARPRASGSSSGSCTDKAAFSKDVTIPDGTTLQAGGHFTKTWQVRNVGTCTWSGYNLVYAGGDALNAAVSSPIQDVGPGEYAEISIEMDAPQRGGTYTGYWQFMNPSGNTFGVSASGQALLWVQITVVTSAQSAATGVPSSARSGGCNSSRNADYESQILTLINNARATSGLNPLTLDDRLSAAALKHSLDMACNNFVDHTGSDGSSWYDRVSREGFANYATARENIYAGNPAFGGDAQGAYNWWMNSYLHRKTILLPDITAIGIAYVFNPDAEYGGYYTTVFARP